MNRFSFRRNLAALLLLAIVWVNGFHVFTLQAVAWTKMYQEYASLMSAAEALDFTISGKDLCGVCLVAEDLRSDMDETLDAFMASGQFGFVSVIFVDEAVSFEGALEVVQDVSVSERQLVAVVDGLATPPPRVKFA